MLRCPGEELLLPAPGCTLLTIAYPYLALAVTAHCTADERCAKGSGHVRAYMVRTRVREGYQEHLPCHVLQRLAPH